jgi:hypothetical protein
VLAADSRAEVVPVRGDPAQTSAYSRAFLRAAATRAEIESWFDAQHLYRRDNQAFNLFLYDRSPFRSDQHGSPGPSAFRTGATAYQVSYEARAAGFPDDG